MPSDEKIAVRYNLDKIKSKKKAYFFYFYRNSSMKKIMYWNLPTKKAH